MDATRTICTIYKENAIREILHVLEDQLILNILIHNQRIDHYDALWPVDRRKTFAFYKGQRLSAACFQRKQ